MLILLVAAIPLMLVANILYFEYMLPKDTKDKDIMEAFIELNRRRKNNG